MIDRKAQRRIIVLFFFLSGIMSATWSSRIPDIQQKLQLSNAALGTVLFAIPVGLIVGLSFASWAVVSFGSKRIMLLSCLVSALFLALAGIASTTFLMMLVLFMVGVGRTVLNLSANTGAVEVQRLLNSAGQQMLRTIFTLAQNSFRLNLRTIRSGTYLLVISHNGEAIGKQMVVVN